MTKVHWYQIKAYLVRNLIMPGSSLGSVAFILKMTVKNTLFIFLSINIFGKIYTSFKLSERWNYHLATYPFIWYLKWKVIIPRIQNKCQNQYHYIIIYFMNVLVILSKNVISAWKKPKNLNMYFFTVVSDFGKFLLYEGHLMRNNVLISGILLSLNIF